MKIIFLMQDIGAVYGAERATMDLADGLRSQGVAAHFFLMEESRLGLHESALRKALESRGHGCEGLPVAGRFSLSLVRGIRDRFRARGGSILHCVGYKADLHGGAASGWGRGFAVVSTVHGWLFRPDLKERFYGWLDVQALRRMSAVVTLSRFYEDMLRRRGIPAGCLHRIPNGLTVGGAGGEAARRDPAGSFAIGLLGRLSWEKNQGLALSALAQLVRDHGMPARLVIAGVGPEESALRKLAADLQVSDHVTFAGYIPSTELFGQIHVLAMTSRVENLPYSIMEAMRAGVPVVSTAVGGIPDLIIHDQTGLLVRDGDAGALALAWRRLAQQPELRYQLADAARRKLALEFDASALVRAHVTLYKQLAFSPKGSRVGMLAS